MVRIFADITVIFTAYPVTWGVSCLFFAWFLKHSDWLWEEPLYQHM